VKSKKPVRPTPRPRRRSPVLDEASFTIVLEDLHAKFAVFGEALQGVREEMYAMRDDLRGEMRAMRDDLRGEMRAMHDDLRGEMQELRGELRGDIAFLRTAVLDLSKRLP
jgi:hypothetical protein